MKYKCKVTVLPASEAPRGSMPFADHDLRQRRPLGLCISSPTNHKAPGAHSDLSKSSRPTPMTVEAIPSTRSVESSFEGILAMAVSQLMGTIRCHFVEVGPAHLFPSYRIPPVTMQIRNWTENSSSRARNSIAAPSVDAAFAFPVATESR